MKRFFSEIKSPLKRQGKVGGAQDQQHSSITTHPQTLATCIVPSIPDIPIPNTTEPASATANEISLPTPVLSHDLPTIQDAEPDIWAAAYKKFAEREHELARDYNTHLGTVSSGDDTVMGTGFLSPGSAKSVVEQLQKTREDKQWHVTFRGKDIKFREQAEKLTKVLLWSNGVVKDALSAQPYAALAWSGVSILLPLLTTGAAKNDAILSHFDEVYRTQIYWKAYQDTSPEEFLSNDNSMMTDLIELYSHIFEYQARTICHLSSAQLSRAWQKVAGWDDWEKQASHVKDLSTHCKERMETYQDQATQERCNRQLEEIYRSRAALQQIYELLEEERKQQKNDHKDRLERELLADLAADHEEYKNFNPTKVQNTCGWFLESDSFRSWRDSEESSLLWVSAGPGCGKSVLSRSLIDECQLSTSAATSIVCYFFFKDGDERREHSANAISAILHQLFIRDLTGNFTSHALPRHKNYGKALATNFSELWDTLLDCAATPDAGEIVCVLDALDECRGNERNAIINKLISFFSDTTQASHRSSRLKFLVTSRPYDTIEQAIGTLLHSCCLRIDGDDHSTAVSEDIDRVIDVKIPELVGNLSNEDRRRIAERLKGMENRTYLWLRLTFSIIKESPSDYSRPSDVEVLLDSLPDEHSKAYERILGQKKSKYTRFLFQLMLAATRPLSIDEANYALALATVKIPFTSHSKAKEGLWDTESFRKMAKNSCGLLVDFHDSKLSFIHQTVREFLTEHPGEGGEWNWRGRFRLPECHNLMFLSCFHYLHLPELDISVQDTMPNEDFYPLFSYAARHWPFHYREQDVDTRANLLGRARNLCHVRSGKTKIWTRVHDSNLCLNGTELDIAAYCGLELVVRAILDEDATIEANDEYYNRALFAASLTGFPVVVEMLLDTVANVNAPGWWGGFTPLQAAVSLDHLGVIRVLFEKRGEQVEVSKTTVTIAAGLNKHAKEIMALILKKRGKDCQIDKSTMEGMIDRYPFWRNILPSILENEEQIYVTEGAIAAVTRATSYGDELAVLLLDKWKAQVQVTEAVMVMAAAASSNVIMTLILEKGGEQARVTEAVLLAAANNPIGEDIISLLLDKLGEQVQAQVTEAFLIAVADSYSGEKVIALLLEKVGEQVQVTEDFLIAVAKNSDDGLPIMALLLEKVGEQVQVTEAFMEVVAQSLYGPQIIALLVEAGKQIQVSDAFVARVRNLFMDEWMASLLENVAKQD